MHDGPPGKAYARPFQAEHLEEVPIVMADAAPLQVVVRFQKRVALVYLPAPAHRLDSLAFFSLHREVEVSVGIWLVL